MTLPLNKHILPGLFILCLLFSQALTAQSKYTINGYFSQAYAISDGNPIFGITSKGTFDYRNAALQFGFQPSEDSRIIIQVNHKRIGKSPVAILQEEIELDWGILEQQLGDEWAFRAGRILLPLGIYNPIRDVSVLLPFYSLPFSPYGDGSYTSETVDGFSLSFNRFLGDNVSLEAEVYFGQWKWKEWYIFESLLGGPPSTLVDEASVRNAIGAWFWINDVIDGLRIGAGGFYGRVEDGIQFQPDQVLGPQPLGLLDVALDYTKERFYLRGEFSSYQIMESKIHSLGGYLQGSLSLTDIIALNIQYESTRVFNVRSIPEMLGQNLEYNRDIALGINFSPTHYMTLKVEGHLNRGFVAERPILLIEDGDQFNTKYAIISISAGF